MGNWTLVIHGTGPHHNFKGIDVNKLVADGEGIMNVIALTLIMQQRNSFANSKGTVRLSR